MLTWLAQYSASASAGWASAEAVHEPGGVAPVHPGRGDLFQVGEGGDRSGAERGSLAQLSVLYNPIVAFASALSTASPTDVGDA
jgi:hypothetical protein